jgi:hypothetical protein
LLHAGRPEPDQRDVLGLRGMDDVVDALVEPGDGAVGVIGAEHQKDGRIGRRLRELLERARPADVHADLREALEMRHLGDPLAQAVAQHIAVARRAGRRGRNRYLGRQRQQAAEPK